MKLVSQMVSMILENLLVSIGEVRVLLENHLGQGHLK